MKFQLIFMLIIFVMITVCYQRISVGLRAISAPCPDQRSPYELKRTLASSQGVPGY